MATVSGDQPQEQRQPILRVVNPDATPEEIAALVAVFSVLGPGQGTQPPRRRAAWNHPARGIRTTHRAGAGGWRTSALPR